jgi:hypothetical protein
MDERLMEKLARLGAEAGIKQMTPEINRFFMLVRADVVAQWPERPVDFGPQPDMHYGMNQDDWKDIVAAISKARDSRGIYLACRPADVFQDWFLALGTFKPKEKNAQE